MGGKKRTVCVVIEFAAVVGLKGEDRARELGLNIRIKVNEKTMNFGFAMNGKSPCIMCKIIKNDQIKLISGYT